MIKKVWIYSVCVGLFMYMFSVHGMMNRDLIMIIDDVMGMQPDPAYKNNLEYMNRFLPIRPGVDAMLVDLCSALCSKAAPILVSGKVWRGFAQARQSFNQKKNNTGSLEQRVYSKVYKPINDKVVQASKHGSIGSIVQAVNKNYPFGSQARGQLEIINDEIVQLRENNQDEFDAFIKNFEAYGTPFDPKEWDIYTYKHVLYLLIPHEYIQHVKENDTRKKIANNEFCGFKLDDLSKLVATDEYNLPHAEPEIALSYEQGLPLDKILVTKKKEADVYPFVWDIYLTGHGDYLVNPSMQAQLDGFLTALQKKQKELEASVGFFKGADYENVRNALQQAFAKMEDEKYAKGLEIIAAMENIYKQASALLLHNPLIFIAGMPSLAFSKTLDFFNDSVYTSFFHYDTCFSGARNLLFPYITSFGQAKRYNYTIVAGTVSDVSTIAMSGLFDLGYSFTEQIVNEDNILMLGKQKAVFVPSLGLSDFKKFFLALHEGVESLKTIMGYVHEEKEGPKFGLLGELLQEEYVAAEFKSVIRFPGGTNFFVHDIDEKVQKITRVTASASGRTLEIDGAKKDSVLLNTYYLPLTLHFRNKLPASFVPGFYTATLPGGITGAFMQKVNVDTGSLNDFANLLLGGAFLSKKVDENPIPRLFLIDELVIGQELYFNVLIFNRIHLPPVLANAAATSSVYAVGMIQKKELKISPSTYWLLKKNLYMINTQTGEIIGEEDTEAFAQNEAIRVYNELYNDYKKQLSEKAAQEGMALVPLQGLEDVLKKKIEKMQRPKATSLHESMLYQLQDDIEEKKVSPQQLSKIIKNTYRNYIAIERKRNPVNPWLWLHLEQFLS